MRKGWCRRKGPVLASDAECATGAVVPPPTPNSPRATRVAVGMVHSGSPARTGLAGRTGTVPVRWYRGCGFWHGRPRPAGERAPAFRARAVSRTRRATHAADGCHRSAARRRTRPYRWPLGWLHPPASGPAGRKVGPRGISGAGLEGRPCPVMPRFRRIVDRGARPGCPIPCPFHAGVRKPPRENSPPPAAPGFRRPGASDRAEDGNQFGMERGGGDETG